MFKIYNIKGKQIPIVDEISDDENAYIYSTLGVVCIERPEKCETPIETTIEKNMDLIINTYKGTERKTVQRSEEEFMNLLDKYFTKYTKILDIEPEKIYIAPLNMRHLAFAHNDNNLEINSYMRYLEEEIIELTIYHELCHLYTLKHYGTLEHDRDFYNLLYKEFPKEEVERIMSNYQT